MEGRVREPSADSRWWAELSWDHFPGWICVFFLFVKVGILERLGLCPLLAAVLWQC